MGFPKQKYWSGLPFPTPGDLPDPGIEPRSPALQADSLLSEPSGKTQFLQICQLFLLNSLYLLVLPTNLASSRAMLAGMYFLSSASHTAFPSLPHFLQNVLFSLPSSCTQSIYRIYYQIKNDKDVPSEHKSQGLLISLLQYQNAGRKKFSQNV